LQEGGSALPAPKAPTASKRSSSANWAAKPALPQPVWLNGAAQGGGPPAPQASAPRLFGVTLDSPQARKEDAAPHLRRGSLPSDSSAASPSGRLQSGFGGGAFSNGIAGREAPVRRVLSEGQAGFGGLVAQLASEEGQRAAWGEPPVRDGVGLHRFASLPDGPLRRDLLKLRTAPQEELARTNGDADVTSDAIGPGSWISVPDSEAEPKLQVKCFVEESPYGVVVDLSQYTSTQQLKHALLSATLGRLVVYQDNDGDMILLGDEEWSFFLKTVSRIYIRR
jgi:hypothetical protein